MKVTRIPICGVTGVFVVFKRLILKALKQMTLKYSYEYPQWGLLFFLMSTHNVCFHGEITSFFLDCKKCLI